MDPNSGQIYKDPTQEFIKKNGLIELTEEEAAELEAIALEERMTTLRTLRNKRKSQSKSVRRAKAKVGRASRRANR